MLSARFALFHLSVLSALSTVIILMAVISVNLFKTISKKLCYNYLQQSETFLSGSRLPEQISLYDIQDYQTE
ncbi:MAG: hypothetical protein K2G83_05800 [Ruminococcus sp.]|nr:hypothetical protein [Ruminococcus sp.]